MFSPPPPLHFMASACVNNSLPMSPDPFLLPTFPDDPPSDSPSDLTPVDFEFCLEDPVTMLPADQLFSDGKLLPLHFSSIPLPRPCPCPCPVLSPPLSQCSDQKKLRDLVDAHLFSPKAPRCSSRWRELLRLKRLNNHAPSPAKAVASHSNPTTSVGSSSRSLKHFLHRSSKSAGAASCSDSSPLLNLPLFKHSDAFDFSIMTSSRLSLSSSSSSTSQALDHEDHPRLSLDSDKTRPPQMRSMRPRSDSLLPYLDNNGNGIINGRGRNGTKPVAASNKVGRSPIRKAGAVPGTGTQPDAAANRGVSVDSPRMNSSGRVVFQSLERSSSSPSSFNGGGQRFKHRGVERSYSAGVRISPVLNVPICTLRGSSGVNKSGSSVFGLGQLFISSPQKKNGNGNGNVGRGQRSK